MHNFSLLKLDIALDKLAHILEDFWLGKLLLDVFAEIRLAQLGDDVGIILGGEDIVEGEDIGDVLEFLQNFDFRVQEGAVDFILQHLEVDDLHCHIFV